MFKTRTLNLRITDCAGEIDNGVPYILIYDCENFLHFRGTFL